MAEILLFTGEVQSGRTTFMEVLVEAIRESGVEVKGFLSMGEGSEERSGFTLLNLEDGSSMRLATRGQVSGWERQGPFCFNPEAIIIGQSILKKALKEGCSLIIVDEVGPMELEGRGWAPALDSLAGEQDGLQIWVTRNRVLDRVRKHWNIPASRVLKTEKQRIPEYLKLIKNYA